MLSSRMRRIVFALLPAAVLGTGAQAQAQGAYRVKDIAPGPTSSYPEHLVDLGGKVIFEANDYRDLWASDGTEVGTVLLHGVSGPVVQSPTPTVVGNVAFFVAYGSQLWKTDGTP